MSDETEATTAYSVVVKPYYILSSLLRYSPTTLEKMRATTTISAILTTNSLTGNLWSVVVTWGIIIIIILIHTTLVSACSDILVTPGASADGSAMIAYNADDTSLFGYLYHYPATKNITSNSSIPIYDWDSGKYLGDIPAYTDQPTYNVIGNGNDQGLVIGESTFGGVPQLAHQPGAMIDYGSMIYLTLQRAATARQAMKVMVDLLDTYGYYSEGESLSIADSTTGEVWIMEIIGRGDSYGKLGAVWVAQRVPDGMMTAHANQARITTFPRDDPDNCLYAPDVVDVAVHYGLYAADQDPSQFSFSDVYDPMSFTNARFSEARVWSIFSHAVNDPDFQVQYQEYAAGRDLSTRMPLFVRPRKPLSAYDVMALLNSHYEGTELDGSADVGGGLFGTPYRPRPLTWEYQDRTYFNERTVAIERTGWSFVAQLRRHMPQELSVLLWFAADDSSTAPRLPVYAASTAIAAPYAGKGTQDGVPGPILKFDLTKAFWVQNMVSNLCYSRWKDAYPMVRQKIDDLYEYHSQRVEEIDERAKNLYDAGDIPGAIDLVTNFSVQSGEALHKTWMDFYGELFARFRDFATIVPDPTDTRCGCQVQEPGLSEETKRRIVLETGGHYEVGDSSPEGPTLRLGASNHDHPRTDAQSKMNGSPEMKSVY